jgi:predicted O-methyltransferase YrrM
MFHDIPQPVLERMAYLQSIDSIDRLDGTSRPQRLRQIPPVTGRFLAILAASVPAGQLLEIGTSAGYSSLWLSLACRQRGDRLVTFEMAEDKAALAQETFRLAGVEGTVTLVNADARLHLAAYPRVAFCFLDCEKEMYPEIYDRVVPNLVAGGIFAADNAVSHQEYLQPFIDNALADERLDALVVPVGKGVLVCRRVA